ncbi:MAG: DEAD/DEAH box helicase [Candidatus Nanopelagicales bacterium]|nr:DEAD/DEAH box helicase [Candidatus Nanopelagicales bacterium]
MLLDPHSLMDSGEEIVHLRVIPENPGTTEPWPRWVSPQFRTSVDRDGISSLWKHQVDFAESAHNRADSILATGTATGKTIAFNAPAITGALDGGTVLYLSPTKALAADQSETLSTWNIDGVRAGVYDGDTSHEDRQWLRKHANYLLTNPDMLHFSILPGHKYWAHYFRHLSFVIIDEAHVYKGVFGAHVAMIIRRLLRIANKYGASPTILAASATSGNPTLSLEMLTGRPATAFTQNTAAIPQRTFVFWQPPTILDTDTRRGVLDESARLLARIVPNGDQAVAFARSRHAVEYVAKETKDLLVQEFEPADLEHMVRAYRGGYLAHERRELEQDLRSGGIRAMAATNALELGIDITGLDIVITAGWPGTKASLWQQVGRAGRSGQEALAIFIAREDPLDTYVLHHPETFFDSEVEVAISNPSNEYVLAPHLCAAAQELPLTTVDLSQYFPPNTPEVLHTLVEQGLLRKRPAGWFWTSARSASALADLRGTGGKTVRVVEQGTGRLCGYVDNAASHRTVHEGAVYTHQGETFVVHELDLDAAVALVEATPVDYTTFARDISNIHVTGEELSHETTPGLRIHFGEVEVTSQTVSFTRRHFTGENLGAVLLDLPVRSLKTKAVWWTFPLSETDVDDSDIAGAIHGAEHASIGMLPLFASCDRWDIGGVSTPMHPDTGEITIFIYDGLQGGAGIAEFGFNHAFDWISATLEAVLACPCDFGCPGCIQSPKCGNGNEPLSKTGAIKVLTLLSTQPVL